MLRRVLVGLLLVVSGVFPADALADTMSWSAPTKIDQQPPFPITAMACPSTSLCVAADDHGNFPGSLSPLSGEPSWIIANGDGTKYITSLSCPAVSLCVAVDLAGNVVTTANAGAGGANWKPVAVEPGVALEAVSCPSVSFCVALDASGRILSSSDPAGTAAAWTISTPLAGAVRPAGLACPSAALCVVIDRAAACSVRPIRLAVRQPGSQLT